MLRVFGAPQRIVTSSQTPRRQAEPLGCDIVRNATVPPSICHDIRPYDEAEPHLFRGWKAGVYDTDGLVCESSLMDRHWTRVSVPYEPHEIRACETIHMSGEAVFCGLLFHHFGHFLLESTNRLWWPLMEDFGGWFVFQNTRPGKDVPDFATRFFRLIGIEDRVRVVETPLSFDRVIVPHRALVIQKSIHSHCRVPFLKAGQAAERHVRPSRAFARDAAGLYVSRTHFLKRRSFGERRLERAFLDEGYQIVHMEEHPLEQQILAVRNTMTIAGVAGSAFHSILFSDARKQCVYICKDYNINSNFFMVDEVMNNDSVYVYNNRESETSLELSHSELLDRYLDDAELNLLKMYKYLELSGVLKGRPNGGASRRSAG